MRTPMGDAQQFNPVVSYGSLFSKRRRKLWFNGYVLFENKFALPNNKYITSKNFGQGFTSP